MPTTLFVNFFKDLPSHSLTPQKNLVSQQQTLKVTINSSLRKQYACFESNLQEKQKLQVPLQLKEKKVQLVQEELIEK